MRPFILDQNVRKALLKVKDYAIANPFSMDDMLDVINGDKAQAGDNPNLVWLSRFGYRIVLSVEQHTQCDLYHISASVPADDKMPNIQAIKMILAALGFPADEKDWFKLELDELNNTEIIHIWIK